MGDGGRGGLAGLLDRALDIGIAARRSFLVNDLSGRRVTVPIPLLGANLAFNANWTAIGPEISVEGFTRVSLWVDVDIGTTVNARFRCVGRHTSGGSDYMMPIYNPMVLGTPYYILVEGEYCEWNVDGTDFRTVLTWDLGNTIPYIQFQQQASAVGDGLILAAGTMVTYGWGS